jgi:hypothetical protein
LGTANTLAKFYIPKQDLDQTVVYREITHHYQVVFAKASEAERKELKWLCDWHLYRKVSRTKIRHRVNFWKNRHGLYE